MNLPHNTVLVGDAGQLLAELPAASVDTVITSPPYFQLRNYGTRGQLGMEERVEEWVDQLRRVFAQIARVLKPGGSAWLNVGDSFSRHLGHGAPPKSLLLGPERLLLALAADGWLVRNKAVWAKTNGMPTSVTDRLACTWEPVYLLVRSAHYFFDLDAIRVPHRSHRAPSKVTPPVGKPPWAGPLAGDQSGLAWMHAAGRAGHASGRKNPGDVWTLATNNYRGGHHAAFPKELVRLPLLATCPERVCARCGLAWQRHRVARSVGHLAVIGELRPACDCQAGWQPGVVLDPFMGSGTTAVMAVEVRRDWLGIELNPEFAALAEARIAAAKAAETKAA